MTTTLITGANRGLGLGFANHYLEQGGRVVAATRNRAGSAALDDLRSRYGDRLEAIELDIAREASIKGLATALTGFAFDLVINNAGTLTDEAFGKWTAATFAQTFAVNTTGPALLAQALLPLMKPGSKLVNISSGLGSCGLRIDPETGLDAYAASKAALNMLTARLAAKLEEREITVVACDPGWVRTRMGGPEAELTVDQSVGAITAMIDTLTPADSGRFLSRHGEDLPW